MSSDVYHRDALAGATPAAPAGGEAEKARKKVKPSSRDREAEELLRQPFATRAPCMQQPDARRQLFIKRHSLPTEPPRSSQSGRARSPEAARPPCQPLAQSGHPRALRLGADVAGGRASARARRRAAARAAPRSWCAQSEASARPLPGGCPALLAGSRERRAEIWCWPNFLFIKIPINDAEILSSDGVSSTFTNAFSRGMSSRSARVLYLLTARIGRLV